MTITTPSGYVVEFKGEDELTYADRRAIQKAMVKSMNLSSSNVKDGSFELTGDVLFEAQDATLKIILKSIVKNGTPVTGDLFAEVMSWTNPADGDAVYNEVSKAMSASPKETTA